MASKQVVVTGVSSGIGYSTAETLIKAGYKVFGSVRRQQDADRLQQELGPSFTPLIFDVKDEASVKLAAQQVRTALNGSTLSALINNAGTQSFLPLELQPISEFRNTIETNLIGTVIVTQAFLPLLGTDLSLKGRPGRIINIGSALGIFGPPFISAYCASKYATEGLSDCLRRELIPYGINVIIVAPGVVKTELFSEKEWSADIQPFADTAYFGPMKKFISIALDNRLKTKYDAASIARTILGAVETSWPKRRYAPEHNFWMNRIIGLLPSKLVDWVLAFAMGMTKVARN